MKKFIPILITLLALLLVAAPACADNKKKVQKEEPRPLMPEPDRVPGILRPQSSLASVAPLAIPTLPLVVSHRASERRGIDVSHYQGRIDWPAVAATGQVQYVYVKATESTGLFDDTYAYNIREARKAGLAVGSYHFFSPNTDAAEQLKNFTSHVNLTEHDLMPMVDIELRGKSTLPKFISNLRTFIQGLEKHYGVKPILYTSVNFYDKYLGHPTFRVIRQS